MGQISPEPVPYVVIGLSVIALVVFSLPFVRRVQDNLELFLLSMGAIAVTLDQIWNWDLVTGALQSPLMIGNIPLGPFQVVLVFGILTYIFQKRLFAGIIRLAEKLGPEAFAFALITLLGLLSGVISFFATATMLGEILTALAFPKSTKTRLAVIGCFAVGFGSCLTPLGGPQCTVLVSKLAGLPYQAGFLFPLQVLGVYLIPGIIALGMLGAVYARRNAFTEPRGPEYRIPETLRSMVMRAMRLYVRIVALVLIGFGFEPLVVWYIAKIPHWGLYWVNISSAVLDNAAMTALEIHPTMALSQIVSVTIAILIAGSMLIVGNMPNVVVSARLKISMREWAKVGAPLGFIAMMLYFVVLILRYPQTV